MQSRLELLRSEQHYLYGQSKRSTHRAAGKASAGSAQDFLRNLVDTACKPLVIFDANLRVVSASKSFYQMFGLLPGLTVGTHAHKLDNWQCNIPDLCTLLEDLLTAGSEFASYEVEHEFGGLGLRVVLFSANKLYQPGKDAVMLLLTIEDVTEQRLIEQERKSSQDRLRTELEYQKNIADTLQRAMIRRIPEDAYQGYAVAAVHENAWDEAEVGGDFYDMFRLEDGRIAVVIGDVMGKGLVAALHTSGVKAALRLLLREQYSPALALLRLNIMLCDAARMDDLPTDTLTACALAVIEPHSGKTVVACAGMELPLLLRAIPVEPTGFVAEPVDSCSGSLLGIDPTTEYFQTTFPLNPGDLLIMVTDGITEARRSRHEFFGCEGFAAAALEWANAASVNETGQGILKAAHDFAGGRLHDDACLVLVRRAG